jgi:hypothetical protein
LQIANETFSVLHHKFLKEIWGDNRTTHKLHYNQCQTDWQNGVYECYIPTRDSADFNLSHYCIAVKVLDCIDHETKKPEAYKLCERLKEPIENIESELLILIAPRQLRYGLVRGFKHRNLPGYFTAVIVNSSPEIIWKRILCLIINFIQKRLAGFFEFLNIPAWIWKWHIKNNHCSTIDTIIERFSYVLRQSFHTFIKLLDHLTGKLKEVLKEIGNQNVAKQALRPLLDMKPADLQRVFSIIREELKINLEVCMWRELEWDKGVRYVEVLKVYANG